MEIKQVYDDKAKIDITREILEALPEWFEVPEGREEYIKDSTGKTFFVHMMKIKLWVFCILSKLEKILSNFQSWV